ncbi:MAG: amidohydrolase family protein [Phycisphaeraceae bacterium]|nr:amidohydrolase family protein [Phycisphaeraceae bacterium]
MTDLEYLIHHSPLCDTHEHLRTEKQYVEQGPDVAQGVFSHYIRDDLRTAGLSEEDLKRLDDASNPDLEARLAPVLRVWPHCRNTGYGEAVSYLALEFLGVEEITVRALIEAAPQWNALRAPGQRLRILREVAGLDHVQIDDFSAVRRPDPDDAGGFFRYDLSWCAMACGQIDPAALHKATDVEVRDLESLRRAMAEVFLRCGPHAVAVKTQHAYMRTLNWSRRTDEQAAAALGRVLGHEADEQDRLCLGDWCLGRGVELATEHGLPIKIHTGHYAGNGRMRLSWIDPGGLCELLIEYPRARFVLMHTAYPYGEKLVSMAKHFPNVWVDFCWAWSIDPAASSGLARRLIHAVPANKVFVFGGDTFWPTMAAAFGWQARRWFAVSLAGQVREGELTESAAMGVARRWMCENQQIFFSLSPRSRAGDHEVL